MGSLCGAQHYLNKEKHIPTQQRYLAAEWETQPPIVEKRRIQNADLAFCRVRFSGGSAEPCWPPELAEKTLVYWARPQPLAFRDSSLLLAAHLIQNHDALRDEGTMMQCKCKTVSVIVQIRCIVLGLVDLLPAKL